MRLIALMVLCVSLFMFSPWLFIAAIFLAIVWLYASTPINHYYERTQGPEPRKPEDYEGEDYQENDLMDDPDYRDDD